MVVAPLAILAHIVAGSLVIIAAPSSNNPVQTERNRNKNEVFVAQTILVIQYAGLCWT